MNLALLRNVILLAFLALTLTACGGSSGHQLVKDVQLGASTDGGDIYVEVSAEFDFGSMTLPSISLPVKHPKTKQEIGTVEFLATTVGTSIVAVDVNISELSGLDGNINMKLPNGSNLPIGGLGNATVVALPIGDTQAQVYMALGDGVAVAGFSLIIKQFDGIGSNLGGVNLFPAFNIGDVRGVAGVFTSQQAGQSGIAFFADASSVINPGDILDIFGQKSVSGFAALSAKSSAPAMISQEPSSKKKSRLEKRLFKLHRKKVEMELL